MKKTKKAKKNNFLLLSKNIFMGILTIYFICIFLRQTFFIIKNLNEIKIYEKKIKNLYIEQENLERQLNDLDNPEYIKKILKEKFNLVEKNETIFKDSER